MFQLSASQAALRLPPPSSKRPLNSPLPAPALSASPLQERDSRSTPRPLRLLERSIFSDRMVFVRAVRESGWMGDVELVRATPAGPGPRGAVRGRLRRFEAAQPLPNG
jgi:hypothetical protein